MQAPEDIYTKNNVYGYKLNINHPYIRKLYTRYKQWKNIAYNVPLSDDERFEFEDYIEKRILKKGADSVDIHTSDTIPN